MTERAPKADALAEMIPPLVHHKIAVPRSSLSFSAACFEGSDWSLAPLQKPEDVAAHNDLARRVGFAVYGLGGSNAYAPNPTKFNAAIVQPWNLNRDLVLPGGLVHLYRNQDHPADGTFLRARRDAGIFSAGGCSVIVVAFRGRLIFAHAGRDCVLDRERVTSHGYQQGRLNESVVHSILAALDVLTPDERQEVHAWVFYSIKPEEFIHRFDNELHGDFNFDLATYVPKVWGERAGRVTPEGVELDVPEIARAQFVQAGVPESHIHLEHAYLADELPHTRKSTGRYLVAIVRHD